MSSGFVSGGSIDNPIERDDEWRRAQQELEDKRREKAELSRQHEGKSLFEILQSNKDAKQAAFEEAARYKLAEALDDDAAAYLDEVLEKKRQQEALIRKDTLEGLDAFRRQQEDAERKALEDESIDAPKDDVAQWAAVGRKRKKGPEAGLLKGIKLRKSSSAAEEKKTVDKMLQKEQTSAATTSKGDMKNSTISSAVSSKPLAAPPAKPSNISLGLGYASSDDED
ncbi:hypothetical protein P153DRAFT_395005 [Dothidotthia symphoricarpi CBS 119687]|uniref:FAM192A/Fyv6 N-terminal domain-containing protein n=1 Tax=Dothidotthia symphoricarpi CBS 119687 TaxID=1392245 RepID=A0A6A6AL86_9PLEO|nr:uncharacterized protein P153DRAFT_395005 [Dothidotthia symphoricarpi CBS 119687]KAF2131694.1 hypothetical protein P153DRAFT_395005 [Dothidotthia symphoricarpi CBS 119687]